MTYKYHSRRSVKRLARRSRRNFIITLIIITFLIYSAFNWILPSLISGIGYFKNTIKPSQKTLPQSSQDSTLAPPVLNIPYEATNTAQIDIKGYAAANSKVKLYIDDEGKGITDVSSNGDFTFQNIDLSLGTNNIYAKTLDKTSKESLSSKTIKVIYMNEKPLLEISEPDDNKIIQGSVKQVKITGKTSSGVMVYINGNQIIISGDGSFESNQQLNEGDNIFTIQAVDMTSNSSVIERKVTYKP